MTPLPPAPTPPGSSLRGAALGVAVVTALLLMVPAVAMQVTHEVAWGPGDFVVAAVLLYGAGLLGVLAVRRVRGLPQRVAVAAAVLCGLALVWAELAVGLFD